MRNGSTATQPARHEFVLSDALKALSTDLFAELKDTSLDGIGVSRETYGASETAAFEIIEHHARKAGLEARWDAARNLMVRLPGNDPAKPCVATGSPLDSVPEGGNFDGAAGVVAGLAVLLDAMDRGALDRDLVLYALRGEESAWFGGPCYFGSRALFGGLTDADFASPRRTAMAARRWKTACGRPAPISICSDPVSPCLIPRAWLAGSSFISSRDRC